MKRAALLTAVLAVVLWAPAAEKPRVTRVALAAMETSFDQRIAKLTPEEPFDLLGATRGVYLEGYGAVFTAEVSLIITPAITPFRLAISKEEIVRVRERKLARVPRLKQAMRDMLVASAASLGTVPRDERIVIGVTLFYFSWEDASGMPQQVVMSAPRRDLLEFQAGRLQQDALEASIHLEEY